MRKGFKGFIIGVILTVMLISTIGFATGITKNIEVVFNSVKLTVNGQKVAAETILYNGTTYVPLRATAEMLGKDVGWDGTTNTASINDKTTNIATVEEKPTKSQGETLSQQNAIKSAKGYLDFSAFSKKGLIKQLEFEGYSNVDATYAVGQITVNWKEQAVKSGKNYLSFTSFSRSGLIKQLEFEGFSSDEATYAVDQIGL